MIASYEEAQEQLLAIISQNTKIIKTKDLADNGVGLSLFSQKASQVVFSICKDAIYQRRKATPQFVQGWLLKSKYSSKQQGEVQLLFERLLDLQVSPTDLVEVAALTKEASRQKVVDKIVKDAKTKLEEGATAVEVVEFLNSANKEIKQSEEIKSQTAQEVAEHFFESFYDVIDEDRPRYWFSDLDDLVGPIYDGELHLIAGASSEGKSMFVLNIIYLNLIRGKNVVLWCGEMSTNQYLMRLVSLYSVHIGEPLPHAKIKKRQLSEEEKERYAVLMREVSGGKPVARNGGEINFGTLHFIPAHLNTLREIYDEAERVNSKMKVDLIVLDYLSLLQGEGSNERNIVANNFKLAKQYTMSFNGSQGVPTMTAHQISEQAKERAEETGEYLYNFLADSSEAKKSIDVGVYLLRTKEHREMKQCKIGLFKHRDGEDIINFTVGTDFDHCLFIDIDTSMRSESSEEVRSAELQKASSDDFDKDFDNIEMEEADFD